MDDTCFAGACSDWRAAVVGLDGSGLAGITVRAGDGDPTERMIPGVRAGVEVSPWD